MRLTAVWPLLPLLVIDVSSRMIKQNPRHRQLHNRVSNRDDPPSYPHLNQNDDIPRGKSIEPRNQRQGQWLEFRKSTSSSSTPRSSISTVHLAEYRTYRPDGKVNQAGAQSHKAISHLTQVASSSSSPPSQNEAGETGVTPSQEMNEWLRIHNEARAQHGAGTVQWNETLAIGAKSNAEQCKGRHTADRGENIASNSKSMSPQVAVDQWMGNAKLFDGRWQESTAHYTQMVWKSTTQVGCYIQECAPGTRYDAKYGPSWQATCRYNPAGNDVTTEKGFWDNTHS